MRLDASNLPDLARGCAVLAAGGPGDVQVALVMARVAVERGGPVEVLTPDEVDDDALVMPCGLVGAPTLAAERLWTGDEGLALRDTVEAIHGATVGALMCFEIGGANGLVPVMWAARGGLPLVDADGMGRTFPGLHQQVMHLAGVTASPVVLADGRGNTLVVHGADDAAAERLSRRATAGLGGVCAGALYCMPAARARSAAICGSLTCAIALGAAIAAAPGATGAARAIEETLAGTVLIDGRVRDIAHDLVMGGSATIQDGRRRQVRLELKNQFLLALEDGEIRAAVPDVIAVLAAETGLPIAAAEMTRGRRVVVVTAPAPAAWRTEPARALVGPASFGYDIAV